MVMVEKKSNDKTEKATTKETKVKSKEKIVESKKSEKIVEIKELPKTVDDPFKILKFVLMTEKAVQIIEKQNKLVFIVDRAAEKSSIKAAVESAFNSPIIKVQTMVDQQGRKKAMVKFRNAGAAGDIAIKLGII